MFRRSAFVLAVLLFPALAVACLWDYDTLQMERSRFPSTLEVVTGKFLRHSNEYYEWRLQDREKRLESEPSNYALYDDIGVALDKLGKHDEAVAIMNKKEKLSPGLYETEANLGTFLIHGGKLEEGLKHIQKAIEINPDAHFGREKYQALMVEYILKQRKDGKLTHPLNPTFAQDGKPAFPKQSFAQFLDAKGELQQQGGDPAAVKGILGMMRFGNYDSPILLEALASLLCNHQGHLSGNDAKMLAARCYLKAAMKFDDPAIKDQYAALASDVLALQVQGDAHEKVTFAQIQNDFKVELEEAEIWYAELRQKELNWIKNGADVDAEFAQLYAADPMIESSPSLARTMNTETDTSPQVAIGIIVLLTVILFACCGYRYYINRKQS